MPAKNGKPSVALKFSFIVVAIVAVAVGAFFEFRDTAIVVPVTRGTAIDAVPGSVIVYADGLTKELKSEVTGKVKWCEPLNPAGHFKKGDELLRLDTTELDRQIAEANRTYDAGQQRLAIAYAGIEGWKAARQKLDEATRNKAPAEEITRLQGELDALVRANNPRRMDAEKNMENVVRRHTNGDASDMELKSAKDNLAAVNRDLDLADFDATQARRAHELAMENFDLQLKQRTILAPSDGVVDEVRVWPGELINGGSVVATFYSDARVVVAKISEEDFGKIKVGDVANVRLFIYGNQPPFDAKVSKIMPTAEPETQRYTVYLDVAVVPEKLIPNSNGQANITVGEHPNALLIPRSALVDGQVLVVKDGRVQVRDVTTDFISLTMVEVTKGVALGEQVIVDNVRGFSNGQFVRTVVK